MCKVIGADCWYECVFGTMLLNQTELLHCDKSNSLCFYSKTNEMHSISNLFYFGTTLYMFRTVFPSIISSLRLYIQRHTIQVLWLLANKQLQNLYDIYLLLYVQS